MTENKPKPTTCSKIFEFYWSVPFFLKCIVIWSLLTGTLCLFLNLSFLSNSADLLLRKLQLWRLFTPTLISTNLVSLLFILLVWLKEARELEKSNGTTRYFLNFLLNSVFIQGIFIALGLLAGLLYSPLVNQLSAGIDAIVINEVSILSLANPNTKVRLLHTPLKIKNKFYPFIAYFCLSALHLTPLKLDLVAGMLYSYLFFFYLRKRLIFRDPVINALESVFPLSKLKQLSSYISLENCLELSMAQSVAQTSKTASSVDQDKSKFSFFLNSESPEFEQE